MKRHLLILLLTALLGVGAVALCKYWNVLFPTGETSEIYRHYHKTPGIRAAYIQNMTVDDTIHFDITLLKARDSATYVWLLRDLGQDEEQITVQMYYTLEDNPYFVCLYKHNDTDLVCSLPAKHTAAILHPYNPQHKKTIIIRSLHKQIKINQDEAND
jgi:hypothetical protein